MNIYNQLEKTYYPGAIELDTERLAIDQCLDLIKQSVGL